mgnify:CR=1 FL=1
MNFKAKGHCYYTKGAMNNASHFLNLMESWFGQATLKPLSNCNPCEIDGDFNIDFIAKIIEDPEASIGSHNIIVLLFKFGAEKYSISILKLPPFFCFLRVLRWFPFPVLVLLCFCLQFSWNGTGRFFFFACNHATADGRPHTYPSHCGWRPPPQRGLCETVAGAPGRSGEGGVGGVPPPPFKIVAAI